MRVAVVDPGSGNIASLLRALARAAREAGLSVEAAATGEPEAVLAAERVVLPGQGAFAACARGLAAPGLREALEEAAVRRARPFLGVCVGMQLMAERGLEHGETPGLGWVSGTVSRMDPRGEAGEPLPLPQMGWNALRPTRPHPLLAGLGAAPHAYFVHGYALSGGREEECAALADYGGPVVAAVSRGNLFGTQFHAEKSGPVGLRLLANFLRWSP